MRSYFDIVGDGGSRILEQVSEQRSRMRDALAGVRHLVAVGSGKGGVGKSTLTLQMALALRGGERRIAILDADLNGPTQARMSGLGTVPLVPDGRGLALPMSPAGLGVVSVGAVVPESEAVDFAGEAAGDSHVWRAAREFTFLGQLVVSVDWGRLDFLLVDLPPGAERTVQYAEFLGREAAFVLVTIPSELSRGVVSRSVAALKKTPNRLLGYIENMAGYHCPGCGTVRPLFPAPAADELGIPRLGSVPFDPELAAACDRGPLPGDRPDGAAVRAVAQAADRVVRALEVPR